MNIHVKTAAQNCHITVIIRIGDNVLLSLTDNDEGFVKLLQNVTYVFEWHVFTGRKSSHADIEAFVTPDNQGFLPLSIHRDYNPGEQDGRPFLFTLK